QWSRTLLLVVFALIVILLGRPGFSPAKWIAGLKPGLPRWSHIAILVVFAITVYGLLTARETCGDLLFFWGPKGVHFFRAGQIDLHYLFDGNNYLAHRDYPPLLPLLYAWSHTVAGKFSWWAAVLFAALCLAGITAIVRAGTGSAA